MKQNKIIICSLILLVKMCLLVVFSSEQNSDLFYPFVKTFIKLGLNPWQYYVDYNLNLDAFPYHPFMLYILSIFTYPSVLFGIENNYINNFLFKLPLLLSDIIIFAILLKSLKQHYFKVILFYFLNPIIIYPIYIHSQLDIIPTAILMLSIYCLIQKRTTTSALFLGLAAAAKAHIFLAIPLLFIYIYKNYSFKDALIYIAITCSVFFFFDLPFLFDNAFWNMVITNEKQALLFDSYHNIGELKIFLPLFAVIMVFIHFFNQRKVNTDLLFFYFGILFTAIIFFVFPSPGWYVWMIPFISIYFVKSSDFNKSFLLYIFFSISYLGFFILFYPSTYNDIIFFADVIDIKINNDILMNVSFTILEASVAAILFTFYKYGIKSNAIYKKTTNTVIGIGGDSGVGKTTLLNDITLLLGNKLLNLEGDGEHKWERGDTNWETFTHLNPKANYIHHQASAIFDLKHNKSIERSEYDHETGKFTSPIKVKPKEYILLSGIHPFYLPTMRKNIDLKIYMDTDESLRRHWKILRDTEKRGYSIEKIIEQIEKRVEDTEKYIYPQKQFADIIIGYYPLTEFEVGNSDAKIELGLKITFNTNIHIENILEQIDIDLGWDYNEDLQTQYIILTQQPTIDLKLLASNNILNLNEILDTEYQWLAGYAGIVQFIILLSLSEQMKRDSYEV